VGTAGDCAGDCQSELRVIFIGHSRLLVNIKFIQRMHACSIVSRTSVSLNLYNIMISKAYARRPNCPIMMKLFGTQRRSFSGVISSWFFVPNQGMTGYELLSRSSALIIKKDPQKTPSGKKYHILTCAHVTHPQLFKNYYPQDWLNYVDNPISKFEQRDLSTGNYRCDWDIDENNMFRHPNLDLSVTHLFDEEELTDKILKSEIPLVELSNSSPNVNFQSPVIFHGFELLNQDDNTQTPTVVNGSITLLHKNRIYAKTEQILEMGMCGGAVYNLDKQFIGMIEGIVDKNNQIDPKLLENAAFIPVEEIKRFLEEIEDSRSSDDSPPVNNSDLGKW
jgi:hypothetical protein